MKQSKLASQILNMLDERKRKAMLLKLMLVGLVSLVAVIWANQWESPLAIIPRTFFGLLLGYLMLSFLSIRMYPRMARYFNVEALERDAQQGAPSLPPDSDAPGKSDE